MLYYTNMASKQELAFRKELSKTLSEARDKSDLTQEEVAKRAGMGTNYYARIERGEITPRGNKLLKLYSALNIKIS